MEPGSCTVSQIENWYFIIAFILLILDLLSSTAEHAFGSLHDQNLSTMLDDGEETEGKNNTSDVLSLTKRLKVLNLAVFFFGALFITETFIIICTLTQSSKAILIAFIATILIAVMLKIIEATTGRLVNKNPQIWANRLSGFSSFICALFSPLSSMLSQISQDSYPTMVMAEVEEQIRDWVENVPENSVLEKEERKMIRSILHFSNTLIREIMIPRVEMTVLDVDATIEEAAMIVMTSGHSRLPVYQDEIDEIIGVLYAKDLLKILTENQAISLKDLLRPALFVPEAKKAGDLLSEMQETGIHMGIVVDEYGGTSGVVSMEDIVEEIVGEIRDEYDETEEQLVREIGPDQYSFLGRIDLEDVNEYLGTHITREVADTLAGFMYSQIGRVPTGGEVVIVDDWTFTIEELVGRRIRRVFTQRIQTNESESEQYNE